MGPVILRAAVMLALGVAVWSQAPRPASLHKITSELSSDVLTAGAQPQQQALSDVGAAATSEAGAGDAVAGDAAADTDATATTSGTGPNLIRTGLMKSTWPVSSPLNTSYPFLMKYLPVYDNTDSCADNACTCGEQGRVSLNTNDASPHSFALHTVAARGAGGARWAASGRLSVEDVEQIVGEELGDLSAGDVSPWLDFATALWAPTLYPYLKASHFFESFCFVLLRSACLEMTRCIRITPLLTTRSATVGMLRLVPLRTSDAPHKESIPDSS